MQAPTKVALLCLMLISSGSCSEDKATNTIEPKGPESLPLGTYELQIEGVSHTVTPQFRNWTTSIMDLELSGKCGDTTFSISLSDPKSNTIFDVGFHLFDWSANPPRPAQTALIMFRIPPGPYLHGDSGTVALTTFKDDEVAGTFNFVAHDEMNRNIRGNGRFHLAVVKQ
jgi:hypothetical protein